MKIGLSVHNSMTMCANGITAERSAAVHKRADAAPAANRGLPVLKVPSVPEDLRDLREFREQGVLLGLKVRRDCPGLSVLRGLLVRLARSDPRDLPV